MRDHKSLLAWQQAHQVVGFALRVCRDHWQAHAAAVFSQLQKAALSIQLNIAEGHAARTPARFHNHLVIAYGSTVETIELLELLSEVDVVPPDALAAVLKAAIRTRRLLLGLMKRYRKEPA